MVFCDQRKMVSKIKIQNMSLHTKQVSKSSSLFNSISSSRILPQFRVSFLPITKLHCLSLSSSPIPLSNPEIPPIEYPFKVRYVMHTFGWSPEIAITKTKYVNFETPEKPERVLAFLKNHGFSNTQISRIVKIWPQILRCNPENTLLPKLEFLSNLGISRTEIPAVVTKEPQIWRRSLEETVIPNFNLISKLLNSNDEAVKMVKRYPIILIANPDLVHIQILLEAGVPGANIVACMCCQYRYIWSKRSHESYRKMVEEVKEMGFDPCRMNFLYAVQNIRLLKSTWKDRAEVLKKYGWSERDIFLAFEKDPQFLEVSKEKIHVVMDFLVNRMGTEATDVANWPTIFGYSLKKNIIPRCFVYQSMVEKGLCKKKMNVVSVCSISEAKFIAKIMKHCESKVPMLLDFCNEMLGMNK